MKKYLILALAVFGLIACKPNKEHKLEEILNYELEILKDASSITNSRADTLLSMYDNYIMEFPKDTNSAIMLLKASDICANVNYCEKSVVYLERLIGDFPDYYTSELAYFKLAQVYEDACQDKEKAKNQYKSFIEKYPESRLATDASVILNMMEMTNELDMIREFEKQNSESNTLEIGQK